VRLYLLILSISLQGIGLLLHEWAVKPGPMAPAGPIQAISLLQGFLRIKECPHQPYSTLPGIMHQLDYLHTPDHVSE
jgi:hypothetical protein